MRLAGSLSFAVVAVLAGAGMTSSAVALPHRYAADGFGDSATSEVAPVGGSAEAKVTDPVPLLELRTGGGADAGWLWTLSAREAASAVTQHGMVQQDTRLGYLRRQKFTGSHPIYRLRLISRSAYLLTASPTERSALVASGDFVDEGVLGYAASTRQPGTSALWRMSNGTEWRVVPESRREEFTGRGYATDGPLGYVRPTYHRVGAIYFATWDAHGNQGIIDNSELVYGRRDWWGGVKDFAGHDTPQRTWHWSDEDWSDLKPSIGYYDDSDPETLERHVAQAKGAGLDHFSFYWYWNPAGAGDENYVTGLRAFLQARNRSDIDFAVMPCLHPWGDGSTSLQLPAAQIDRAAHVLVDEYLAQPNYLRANDGRPILEICDTRGIGSGSAEGSDLPAVRQFTDAVRARAKAKLGEDVLILRNSDLGLDDTAAGIDGQQCQGQFDSSRSYPRYVDNQRAFFASRPGILVRCATSHFDERPRIAIQIPDPQPATDESLEAAFRWYPDQSLAEFRRLLGFVQQDIAESTRPQLVDNMVLLYAWNEWHEGGYVEPNVKDGCGYLNAARAAFQLRGSGCVTNPPLPTGTP
ncbi:glycoside hydrolase family 99-like domain-containing protein [Actinopolymorpha sp. B11F2]|uniref:glycoside hydrolase family 99-like domain-containing protein n=1 Tax=Actinopolymorpha sp. B11F2 TaxID=3160862 RepID=UPI0032E488DC